MSAAIWTVRRAKRDMRRDSPRGYTTSRHVLRLRVEQVYYLGWKPEIKPRV